MPTALIIDDDAESLLELSAIMREHGFSVDTARDLESARNRLLRELPELAELHGRASNRLANPRGLEKAIAHPANACKTPLAVAHADHLTGELRQRILDVWELDIHAQLREEDEGGPVRPTNAGVLRDIGAARDELEAERGRRAG
jgi:DNA-binding NtrC family response regulator